MSSIGDIIAELRELTAYAGAMRLVTVCIAPLNPCTPQTDDRSTLTVGAFEDQQAKTNFKHFWNAVAGAAMFLYDYFLTVGMEVDLVWSSKWGFMKVLYVLQRYLPFVDAAILSFLRERTIYQM